MNPLGLIFGGLITAAKESYGLYMKKKIARVEGEIAIQSKVVEGTIDYNSWAQKAGQTSWKDEWLTIWTTLLVSLHFFPKMQPYLEAGWGALAKTAPDWFGYCFVGMYVSIYGLKGWKIFKNGA